MPSRALIFLLVLLGACSSKWTAVDVDGDGYTPWEGDCWDAVDGPEGTDLDGADIHPDVEETWYDGIDQDCDGQDDYDRDEDGALGAADGTGEDCDDTDPSVYPGAADSWYDGVDSDCGGEDDYDQDGDGDDALGYADGGDCDDLDPDVNSTVLEVWYDGVDQDCDGNDTDQDGDGFAYTDECDDTDPERYPDPTIEETWYDGTDDNCDGNDGDQDEDGYVPDWYAETVPDWAEVNPGTTTGDCWDDADDTTDIPEEDTPINGFGGLTPSQVNPGEAETWYDGVDQDCDGTSDFDQDGDGYDTEFYEARDGMVGDDCIDGSEYDDDNPGDLAPYDVHPDAIETWYDGTDQNCQNDDDYDQDTDGYQAEGYGEGSDDDCEDTLPDVNPGETEDCSTSIDDNCDDDTNDVGALGCTTYYVDADSDTYGTGTGACLCETTSTYEVTNDGDCNDASASVNPGASETTGDEIDENCDGSETCYADNDNDGYRTTSTKTSTDSDCADTKEATSSDPSGDCDDNSDSINPGATEVTGDEIDETCDGKETCYADNDNDGYRTTSTVSSSDSDCSDSGEAASGDTSGDCDDTTSSISPGASEVTGDEIDETCDGKETCYADNDNDGYRTTSTKTSADSDCADTKEATSSDPSGDCDDNSDSINPGATEVTGDEIDENCDGYEVCYVNLDSDDYRTDTTVTSSTSTCSDAGESPSSLTSGDCLDTDELTYPGATETCEDKVVNDCDGTEEDALAYCGWNASYTTTGTSSSGTAHSPTSAPYAKRYGEAKNDKAGTRVAFGADVDADGDDELLISSTAMSSSTGKVYVVRGVPTASSKNLSTASYIYSAEGTNDGLGLGLASGFDTDNDGYNDLLMGAPYNDSSGASTLDGAIYLILGGSALPPSGTLSSSIYDAKLTGAIAGDYAGMAVAGVGDFNDDGYDDVLIGAEKGDGTKSNSGVAYLVLGPVTSMGLGSADATWCGGYSSEKAGDALAGGDLDDDGTPDLFIGAPYARHDFTTTTPTPPSDERGLAFILLDDPVLLSSGQLSTVADVVLAGAVDNDHAGTSLAVADIDGDGADDLLIGAPGSDAGDTDGGTAYVVLGGSSLPTSTLTLSSADAILTGISADDAAGTSVTASDLTGDDAAEVIVGAPGVDAGAGSTDLGAVYLFFGGVSGTASLSVADVVFSGETKGDALGTSVAAGGDADEDGYLDLLMGAPGYDYSSPMTDVGMAYLITGTGY